MIDLLPPKVDITINAKIRLNILAGVLDEVTKACGVSIEKDLRKGIVDRDVIEKIFVSFYDRPKHICGQIVFEINWERFELLVKTDKGEQIYSNLDTSKNISSQLDKRLYDAIKMYVRRIKSKYRIKEVSSSFVYREKYTRTNQIHNATRSYMGHVPTSSDNTYERNQDFTNEIVAAFQGLDGLLNVRFKV